MAPFSSSPSDDPQHDSSGGFNSNIFSCKIPSQEVEEVALVVEELTEDLFLLKNSGRGSSVVCDCCCKQGHIKECRKLHHKCFAIMAPLIASQFAAVEHDLNDGRRQNARFLSAPPPTSYALSQAAALTANFHTNLRFRHLRLRHFLHARLLVQPSRIRPHLTIMWPSCSPGLRRICL